MWFRLSERNTLRPRKKKVVLLKADFARVCLSPRILSPVVTFYRLNPWHLHYALGSTGGPGVIWPLFYRVLSAGGANDVFNGMRVAKSYRLTTSLAYAARRWVVGSLGTVAVRLSRVFEPPLTVATHRERAVSLRCTVAVLQSSCPLVLLTFNAPSAARLALASRRPCRVAT
jgi:hypothetical protein